MLFKCVATHHSGCVSMGAMGSADPIEFRRRVPEQMEFEQIFKQMQQKQTFETYISLKIKQDEEHFAFFSILGSYLTLLLEKKYFWNPWIFHPNAGTAMTPRIWVTAKRCQ